MHSIAEIAPTVPAFLAKLWKMVEDPLTNDLITWSSTGTSFVINDEIRFARELLPMYYKHNNMASFIRQLNMYGFHKIVSPEAGSMKLDSSNEIEFTHVFFMRGHPYLLDNIKRKIGVTKALPGQLGEKTPQVINKVLTDVRQMKGRQENMDSRLTAMKLENRALWKELSVLRQKHSKQRQIVNKLIQFLVTIMQQNHNNFSVKRTFPRMLQHYKSTEPHQSDEEPDCTRDKNKSPMVIHELDPAELLETVVEAAESESVSTSDVSDYFTNQTSEDNDEDNVVVNIEMPESVKVRDGSPETIIGMAEDVLVPNTKIKQEQSPTNNNTILSSTPLFVSHKPKQDVHRLKPKYLKLITTRPKTMIGNQEITQKQLQIKTGQQLLKKDLQHQIKVNKKQIEKNQQQIERDQQEVKYQQHLLKSQQQQLQRSKMPKLHKNIVQKIPKSQVNQLKNSHVRQLQKGQIQSLQKAQTQELIKNQVIQLNKKQEQDLLKQRLQQQSQPYSESVLTIPFDSGTMDNIISEVDVESAQPLFVENGSVPFDMPMIVEVPPMASSPAQTSPSIVSSQDILISSPIVVNDPVMTPQCEPVLIPAEVSPESSNDMQVACVDNTQVTSPSLVTRNEMDTHLDSMHSDLENLKELLQTEGISLDANTLLGYFNDDPLSYNISDLASDDDPSRLKENNGNELMTYSPSLFDLTDLMGNDWSLPSPGDQLPAEDSFADVNTPSIVPHSPSFPTPAAKKRKL